jgi:FkbH-like protein
MKLTQALRINNAARNSTKGVTVFLATGFTPLSLPQFLAAHLSLRMDHCRVDVSTGIFGDLAGNIHRMAQSQADFGTVCIEWDDLDPRLGVRRLSAITWRDFPEMLAQVRRSKENLTSLLSAAADKVRVAVSLPHLPIPALSYSPAHLMSEFEAELSLMAAEMQLEMARIKTVRVLRNNFSTNCLDLTATFYSGFPYTVEHASALAESLAKSLMPASPKKGIIVDLDDTLWKGILGDDGVSGVYWDLDHQAQHYGLFQRFLHALAAEGTLVAIATKNSPGVVKEIFESRSDLLLKEESVFPFEVHWGPKSESVARILATWNISADDVVFVDDSPLELAEVQAAHPGLSCMRFAANDLTQFQMLLQELREAFAKDKLGKEDALRAESLRDRALLFSGTGQKFDSETLLRDLQSELTFEAGVDAADERALELVNKTNQFNINGKRFAEPFWRHALARPGAFLLTCSYKDKLGALGKIAVIMGVMEARRVLVETWVMSCRAFARRIEFACLQQLFEVFRAEQVVLQYQRTPRNNPVYEMLVTLGLSPSENEEVVITKEHFYSRVAPLYHTVAVKNSKRPGVATHV